MTVQEFCNQTIGKKIDVDRAYGNQCVDLFNYFNKLNNNGAYINCKPSGYAKSIYENRANNGVLNYYDVVPTNQMNDGDWAVWGNCQIAPDSHIAMFRRDNGNNTGLFLSQTYNQNVEEQNISYVGLIGALRPKQYVTNNNQTTKNIDEIANEVIKGLWGNGEERKSKITNAGYNYNDVQNKVNEILNINNNTLKKNNNEIADEVIKGLWGNGEERKNRIISAGYNYNEIQALVNEKLK